MLKLENEAELKALHSGNVKESLHLEYKASDAIDKANDKKKREMAEDISAFANADGGQIIYGMKENKDHEPDGLDEGLDPKLYPEIWFEQVLQQHVTPLLDGVKPRHVPLSNGRVAVVIDIPATKGDPHQASGRYFRRHNFNRLVMEHYEVRAAFNRVTNPEPFVSLSFGGSSKIQPHFKPVAIESDLATIVARISNRAATPALYTQITIGIDTGFPSVHPGQYFVVGNRKIGTQTYKLLRQQWPVSQRMPIFKEAVFDLEPFYVSVHEDQLLSTRFYIWVEVLTPGFSSTEMWYPTCRNGELELLGPRRLPYEDFP